MGANEKHEATYHSGEYMMDLGHVRHAATERYADRITGTEFDRWIATVKAEAWDEGAKVGYDLASDDIGAWEVLHEFPEEFPDEAVNPYK